MKTDRINLIAPINKLGYGVTGANLTAALSRRIQVGLIPIGEAKDLEPYLAKDIGLCLNRGLVPSDAPSVRIWHQHDMRLFGTGKRIGFPIFELDRFSPVELANLAHAEYLFVCSKWAEEIVRTYRELDHVPVGVVPLGYDPAVFTKKRWRGDGELFTFLNIGKWEIRKGHDILPRLFQRAFGPSFTYGGCDVRLQMMCTNPFLNQEENNAYQDMYRRYLCDAVSFIPRVQFAKEVAREMNAVEAFLAPARAEGWNLELLEAIACGIPAIATGYSAHNDFCPAEYLIPTKEKELAFDGRWFNGNGSWAKLDKDFEDEFIHRCRRLVEDNEYYIDMVAAGQNTRDKFTWDNSASVLLNHLENWGM